MNNTLAGFCFFCLLLCVPMLTLGQEEAQWKFQKEEEGVRVFTRKVANSPMKQVKVQKVMQTRLSSLVALMKDVANHHQWVYVNKEGEVLESDGDYLWILYTLSNAPWPLHDRDIVARSTLSQDSVTRVVRNEGFCDPDFMPEKKGVVRIRDFYSLWELQPLDDGKILVTFEFRVNLGGNVPAWLINMVIAKGPYQTILNMETEVAKPKYKNAQIDFIID